MHVGTYSPRVLLQNLYVDLCQSIEEHLEVLFLARSRKWILARVFYLRRKCVYFCLGGLNILKHIICSFKKIGKIIASKLKLGIRNLYDIILRTIQHGLSCIIMLI